MKQLRFFVIGLVLLPLTALAAPSTGLYERMRAQTLQELLQTSDGHTSLEESVKGFTAKVLSTSEVPLQPNDIPEAFDATQFPTLCAPGPGKRAVDIGVCTTSFAPTIQSLAEKESDIRALGRDLQVIASGFEAPVLTSDYSKFPAQAYGILRIWRAGTGSSLAASGTNLRVVTLTKNDDANELTALKTALTALDFPQNSSSMHSDAFTAAVWRYEYGKRLVAGDLLPLRKPPVIPNAELGSERQELGKHFPAVEAALEQFWTNIKNRPLDPPLRTGELALFTLDTDALSLLPENVTAWGYRERLKTGEETGDAGLQWSVATDPVFPSLCKDNDNPLGPCDVGDHTGKNPTTLGGAFPPPPATDATGNGLCYMPYQRRGYLCRPFEVTNVTECKEALKPEANAIVLGSCTGQTGTRATLAGPDACEDSGWKAAEVPFDPNTQCKVNLKCEENAFAGVTTPKGNDGVITVKVDLVPESPPAYLFIHELVHARQECTAPPGTNPYQSPATGNDDPLLAQKNDWCCRTEGEAYLAECQAYSDDGIFGPNGEAIGRTSGLPLNTQTCSQILTDYSCRSRGFGSCPATFSFSKGDPKEQSKKENVASAYNGKLKQGLDDILKISVDNRPKGMPVLCKAALDAAHPEKTDPRITAALREANQLGRKVCDPNRQTSYANTIGGNMCAFDGCVEQSLEDHTLIPGQAAFTVQEAAHPNDACEPAVIDEGSIAFDPQDSLPTLPAYKPARMIQELDTAFCQTNGLPPAALPVLCGGSTSDVTGFPTQSTAEQAGRLQNQLFDTQDPMNKLDEISEAVGFRIGSELYNAAIQRGVDRLAEVITDASGLLDSFTKVKFSAQECPLNNADGKLFTQPATQPFCNSTSSAP